MVFQFEHVMLDHGATKWEHRPLRLTDLKALARPLAGGPGRRRLEQPVLEQPRPAARGLALRRRRRAPRRGGEDARHGAAPAPRHAVRLPGRGARHDERRRGPGSRTSATSSRSTTTRRRSATAPTPRRCSPTCAAPGATTRARRCSGTPPSTPASRPARRGSRSTRTTARSTPRRRAPTRDSVFHHYRRLIELRHTEPAVAHGDFTMLLPDDEQVYAFTRRLGGDRAARARQLLGRAGRRRTCRARGRTPRSWSGDPAPDGGLGARAVGGPRVPARSVGEALRDDLAPRHARAAQRRPRRLGHRGRAADVDVARGDVGDEPLQVLGREQRAARGGRRRRSAARRRAGAPARRARRAGSRPPAAARGRRRRCRRARRACPRAARGSA